jgi:phosphoribosyl-ATP pyrophosphohydrolase
VATDEVPQEQSMPVEQEQVQETQVEAKPEVEQPEASLIDRYRSSLDGDTSPRSEVPEESELSRLRQQVSRMEGELRARNEQLDSVIAGGKSNAPEPSKEVNEAFDPAVQAMLNKIQEEAPEKLPSAVAMVASQIAQKQVQAEVAKVRQEFQQAQEQSQTNEQTLQFRQQFHSGLDSAKEKLGGVYAEVVEDYEKNKENSLLFRKLTDNPYLLTSPEEAVKAVGVDIQMWKQVGSQQAPVQQAAAEGSSTTAVTGEASERGISLNEPKPEAPDEAQQLFDLVKGAKTPSLPWVE